MAIVYVHNDQCAENRFLSGLRRHLFVERVFVDTTTTEKSPIQFQPCAKGWRVVTLTAWRGCPTELLLLKVTALQSDSNRFYLCIDMRKSHMLEETCIMSVRHH